MTPQIRQMLGLVTVGLFVLVGVSLILEEQLVTGILVLAFAALRLMLWIRQQLALRGD